MTDHESTSEQRIASLRSQIETAKAEIEDMTSDGSVSKEIVALAPSAAPAEVQRQQMAQARGRALKKAEEVRVLQKALVAEIEAQARAAKAEMEALLSPLMDQMKRMEEGLWTVNLYLGRDEEIVPLVDIEASAPAPAETPFTLRQQVLSMDEETAAWAEEGGIDARHIEVFDDWIAQPENLARVLPEIKGVVALVPRRRGREYGDPWLDGAMKDANRWTYFLIRNGDRLWRMKTDFVVGKHLIPATDEFTGLFVQSRYDHQTRETVRTPITPGTKAWDDAEKRQDARQRHYMRMALILQGLVDRTTVFHPLPADGINLLDGRTYESGAAVLVRDAEAVLTDGRPDFYAWLAAKTANLRVGMRIMGAFDTDTFRKAGDEWEDRDQYGPNDRITPRARSRYDADKPKTGQIYWLEAKKAARGWSGYTFSFARTRERWINNELRAPKTQGTCLVTVTDKFILPIDLITAEECHYYLGARSHRHAYEEMFPLLKAAIETKTAEADAEAPFRALLASELLKADPSLETIERAAEIIDELVSWWKFRNKHHRALNGEPAHEARAIRDILAEHQTRLGLAATQGDDEQAEADMVQRLLAHDPSIMVIGRKRDGGYLAFAPQPRTYPAGVIGHPATNVDQPAGPTEAERVANAALDSFHRLSDRAFEAKNAVFAAVADNVYAVEYTTTKTGRSIKTREWVQPGTRTDQTRVLHTTKTWERWDRFANPNEHLTDGEITDLLNEILPTVEAEARRGWRTRFRINGHDASPFEPLLLGVALRSPSRSETGPVIEVHLIETTDPETLGQEPCAQTNNIAVARYGKVTARVTKSRDGVVVHRSDLDYRHMSPWDLAWQDKAGSYTTATPARPWHYYWDGRAKDARALVEFPANQAVAIEREARCQQQSAAVRALRDQAREALWHAKRVGDARLEAAAFARFIEDYADPDLWESHKQNARLHLEISMHPHGRDVPEAALGALYWFADRRLDLTGHTIASAIETAGLSTDDVDPTLLDLPLWAEPVETATEPVVEPEGETDPAEAPAEPEDDGMRIAEDGTIIVAGTVIAEARDDIEQGSVPALRTTNEEDH